MLFASFDFLLFFSVAFVGYWALVERPVSRALWVVGASYFFYMAGPKPSSGPLPTPWYFVGLLVSSTLVIYVCALRIAAAQVHLDPSESPRHRPGRIWLWVSLVTNLGLLGYFKYTGFLFEIATEIAALWGVEAGLPTLRLLLPVGISFYTFQSLSYTIDVYRGTLPAERSLLKLSFFMAFFPQLVAGPIVRASEFLPQLRGRPRLTREDVDFALGRVSKGLVKKVVLGDFIAASLADVVFASPSTHSSLENLIALYAFTLQIYADFSGYSDIAVGLGRLLGLRLPENFNRPYQAVDVADFWRRWHITLSTWLRDYVYFPLGGSRDGVGRSLVNLWITMFLVGIWHGASWNFLIYASLQACAMVYNRICRLESKSSLLAMTRLVCASLAVTLAATLLGTTLLESVSPWVFGSCAGALALLVGLLPRVDRGGTWRAVHVLLTLHFCVLSRIFFRSESLDSARIMAEKLVQWDGLGVREGWFEIQRLSAWLREVPALAWAQPLSYWGALVLLVAGFAVHYTKADLVQRVGERWIARVPAVLVGMAFACLMGLISLLLSGPRANIYFAF